MDRKDAESIFTRAKGIRALVIGDLSKDPPFRRNLCESRSRGQQPDDQQEENEVLFHLS